MPGEQGLAAPTSGSVGEDGDAVRAAGGGRGRGGRVSDLPAAVVPGRGAGGGDRRAHDEQATARVADRLGAGDPRVAPAVGCAGVRLVRVRHVAEGVAVAEHREDDARHRRSGTDAHGHLPSRPKRPRARVRGHRRADDAGIDDQTDARAGTDQRNAGAGTRTGQRRDARRLDVALERGDRGDDAGLHPLRQGAEAGILVEAAEDAQRRLQRPHPAQGEGVAVHSLRQAARDLVRTLEQRPHGRAIRLARGVGQPV